MMQGIPGDYARLRNPLPATPEVISAGETLYQANCAACHGSEGAGDGSAADGLSPPPANLRWTLLRALASDGYLMWAMSEGGAHQHARLRRGTQPTGALADHALPADTLTFDLTMRSDQNKIGPSADSVPIEGPTSFSLDEPMRVVVVAVAVAVAVAEADLHRRRQAPHARANRWERAAAKLLVVAPFTLMIIFVLLYPTFRRFDEALLLMATLPFALVGGIWLLYVPARRDPRGRGAARAPQGNDGGDDPRRSAADHMGQRHRQLHLVIDLARRQLGLHQASAAAA